jgi:ketosteroid isomerase-like protein
MSENLDLVRSIFVDWERGDFSSAEWADPEIEFVVADGPEPGRWGGLAGMRQGLLANMSAWQDMRVEADEYREVDDEHVLVLEHFMGRGRTSGLDLAEMGSSAAAVFRLRDGAVTRLVTYFDRDHALADLGLAE